MSIENAYALLFSVSLIIFGVLIGIVLIRSVIGPRITDRIMCINMIGTMVICCIMILSGFLDEGYLLDVALIYAMISFIAVLMMATTYIPKHPTRARYGMDAYAEIIRESQHAVSPEKDAAAGEGQETGSGKGAGHDGV